MHEDEMLHNGGGKISDFLANFLKSPIQTMLKASPRPRFLLMKDAAICLFVFSAFLANSYFSF